MQRLFLEDLKELTEAEVKEHLVQEYSGQQDCEATEEDKQKVAQYLENYDVLIAYESVGSWGCDSSSYFLLRHKETGQYQEFEGSHCSCYGFEGQFEPGETTLEYLKSDKFYLSCGGYDENEGANTKAVKDFIAAL